MNSSKSEKGSKPLIFVVDDEPMLLELATVILEPLGYNVKTFRDPQTALDAFRSRYNISPSIPVLGPWTGRLNNAGDRVDLYKPDAVQLAPHPDAGHRRFLRLAHGHTERRSERVAQSFPGQAQRLPDRTTNNRTLDCHGDQRDSW